MRRSASCNAAVVASSADGALGHSLLQFGVEPLECASLSIQLRKDTHLGAEDLGNDGDGDVVDGAAFVSAQPIEIVQHDSRHEDDRRLLKSRMLPNHRRELVSVELRHAHVDEHDGDLVFQQAVQRLCRRVTVISVSPRLLKIVSYESSFAG